MPPKTFIEPENAVRLLRERLAEAEVDLVRVPLPSRGTEIVPDWSV